jgi:hypothetical protein
MECTVLFPYVSAERFDAGVSMWTECTRVPMTDGKLRVGYGMIGSRGKRFRVGQVKQSDETRESSTFS